MKKILRDGSTWRLLIFTLLLIAVYGILSFRHGFSDIPSAKINDVFVKTISTLKLAPEELDEFVIVAIDNDSIDFSNMRWPWRRGFMGDILNDISIGNPKSVFFDFVLTGRSEMEEDERLQNVLSDMKNVIIASFINENGLPVFPHPIFTESAYAHGFINNPFDKDNIIRRSRTMSLSKLSVDERVGDYSGIVKLVSFYNGISDDYITYNAKKKSIESVLPVKSGFPIKLNDDRTMSVNYSFSPSKFTIIPAWKVFKRQISVDTFKNKIVLMGVTAELTHDMYKTPLGTLPGIVIKAYELATVLSQGSISRFSYLFEYLILIVLLFIVGLFSYRFVLGRGFGIFCSMMLIYYAFYFILVWNNVYTDGFAPILLGGLIYIGANFYKQVRLRHDINKLQVLAVTDSLTGLYVRRYFQLRLKYEWSHARKTGSPFSLLMLDIDFFKNVNDTYGHLCGDMVLSKVSFIIQECCRKVDVVCRYGGEEFAIILAQTDHEGASFLAEKIRSTVEKTLFTYEQQEVKTSISCGITTYGRQAAESPEELIARADDCLYKAKEGGRNRVVSCSDKC